MEPIFDPNAHADADTGISSIPIPQVSVEDVPSAPLSENREAQDVSESDVDDPLVLPSELESLKSTGVAEHFRKHPLLEGKILCFHCFSIGGVKTSQLSAITTYSEKTSSGVLKKHLDKHHPDAKAGTASRKRQRILGSENGTLALEKNENEMSPEKVPVINSSCSSKCNSSFRKQEHIIFCCTGSA